MPPDSDDDLFRYIDEAAAKPAEDDDLFRHIDEAAAAPAEKRKPAFSLRDEDITMGTAEAVRKVSRRLQGGAGLGDLGRRVAALRDLRKRAAAGQRAESLEKFSGRIEDTFRGGYEVAGDRESGRVKEAFDRGLDEFRALNAAGTQRRAMRDWEAGGGEGEPPTARMRIPSEDLQSLSRESWPKDVVRYPEQLTARDREALTWTPEAIQRLKDYQERQANPQIEDPDSLDAILHVLNNPSRVLESPAAKAVGRNVAGFVGAVGHVLDTPHREIARRGTAALGLTPESGIQDIHAWNEAMRKNPVGAAIAGVGDALALPFTAPYAAIKSGFSVNPQVVDHRQKIDAERRQAMRDVVADEFGLDLGEPTQAEAPAPAPPEPRESYGRRLLRTVAESTVGGDMALALSTDPLTYVTGGAGGLVAQGGRQATQKQIVQATARRAAQRAGVLEERIEPLVSAVSQHTDRLGSQTGRLRVRQEAAEQLGPIQAPRFLEEFGKSQEFIGGRQFGVRPPVLGEVGTLLEEAGRLVPGPVGERMRKAAGRVREAGASRTLSQISGGRLPDYAIGKTIAGAERGVGRVIEAVGQKLEDFRVARAAAEARRKGVPDVQIPPEMNRVQATGRSMMNESTFERSRQRVEAQTREAQARGLYKQLEAHYMQGMESIARRYPSLPKARRDELARFTIDPDFAMVQGKTDVPSATVLAKLGERDMGLSEAAEGAGAVRVLRPRYDAAGATDNPLVAPPGLLPRNAEERAFVADIRRMTEEAADVSRSFGVNIGENYNRATGDYYPRVRSAAGGVQDEVITARNQPSSQVLSRKPYGDDRGMGIEVLDEYGQPIDAPRIIDTPAGPDIALEGLRVPDPTAGRPLGKALEQGERIETDPLRVLPPHLREMARRQAQTQLEASLGREFGRTPMHMDRLDPRFDTLRVPLEEYLPRSERQALPTEGSRQAAEGLRDVSDLAMADRPLEVRKLMRDLAEQKASLEDTRKYLRQLQARRGRAFDRTQYREARSYEAEIRTVSRRLQEQADELRASLPDATRVIDASVGESKIRLAEDATRISRQAQAFEKERARIMGSLDEAEYYVENADRIVDRAMKTGSVDEAGVKKKSLYHQLRAAENQTKRYEERLAKLQAERADVEGSLKIPKATEAIEDRLRAARSELAAVPSDGKKASAKKRDRLSKKVEELESKLQADFAARVSARQAKLDADIAKAQEGFASATQQREAAKAAYDQGLEEQIAKVQEMSDRIERMKDEFRRVEVRGEVVGDMKADVEYFSDYVTQVLNQAVANDLPAIERSVPARVAQIARRMNMPDDATFTALAQGYQREASTWMSRAVVAGAQVADAVTNHFKRLALIGRPAYNALNFVTDSVTMFVSGVNNPIGDLRRAALMAQEGHPYLDAVRSVGVNVEAIQNFEKTAGFFGPLIPFTRAGTPTGSSRLELTGLGRRQDLRILDAADPTSSGARFRRAREVSMRALTLDQERVSAAWDALTKLALYTHARDRMGLGHEAAWSHTARILIDYELKTNIERYLKPFVPFTKWLVQAPLAQATAFAQNPGRGMAAFRLEQQAFGQPTYEEAPEHLKKRGMAGGLAQPLRDVYSAMRQAAGGSDVEDVEDVFAVPRGFSLTEAFHAPVELLRGNPDPFVQSMGPVPSAIAEVALRRSLQTGRPQEPTLRPFPPGTPFVPDWARATSPVARPIFSQDIVPLVAGRLGTLLLNQVFQAPGDGYTAPQTFGETRQLGMSNPRDLLFGQAFNMISPFPIFPAEVGKPTTEIFYSPEAERLRTDDRRREKEMQERAMQEAMIESLFTAP